MPGNPVKRRKMRQGTALNPKIPIHSRTTRLTVSLPKTLLNRLRDTVYWIPQLTLARLVETAIHSALHQLEAGNGGPFPRRVHELKPGRPKASHSGQQQTPAPLSYSTTLHPAPMQIADFQTIQHATRWSIGESIPGQGVSESS